MGLATHRSGACIILGAGFSYVARLPLADDLLTAPVHVASREAIHRFLAVREAYCQWQRTHSGHPTEEFLAEVFGAALAYPPWWWVAQLIAATLATPTPPDDRRAVDPRCAPRVISPVKSPVHQEFWHTVFRRFDVLGVITTNYDLLIERGMRHRPMVRPPTPGFFYGGLHRPQVLEGVAMPFSVQLRQLKPVELTGSIPLFKLHGSLNWCWEDGRMITYQDVRAAFRLSRTCAIVPPVPEKSPPDLLSGVWEAAEECLRRAPTWVVCGYSLSPYDQAVCDLFRKATTASSPATIVLMDPRARDLAPRWHQIAPTAQMTCLPGLPDALHLL